ncbi:MAG: hypothetical protein HOP15_18860 [Planctomycetes bacterium]|nr:hypothetical protein [Planctomycetota bacterium]
MVARALLLVLLLSACSKGGAPAPGAAQLAFQHDEAFLHAYKELLPDEMKCYDPLAVIAMRPGQTWSFAWPEHPEGRIRRATNGRGFNEDAETAVEKRGLRILVSGDSHTEGVVSNEESFPNVLERFLRAAGRAQAEVLNAGVGYTGPHCYLGMLRKHLDLAPDLFIATLFSGNDFMDDLRVAYLQGLPGEPQPDEAYYAPLREAEAAWPTPCWQGVNQAYRFKRFPVEAARALDAVEGSFADIQDLCSERGIRLLVVVLPTKYDVDLTEQRAEFARLAEHLGLTAEEMGMNERLAGELIARLKGRGVACLDATPTLRSEKEPAYWRRDHHLSSRGHLKLAELLLERVEEFLPPR